MMTQFSLLALFLLSHFAIAAPVPDHLDLELTSEEYALLLQQAKSSVKNNTDPEIKEAVLHGERLSKWINLINSKRSPESAIRLTSETTRRGYPIDKPSTYSPTIIKNMTLNIFSNLPKEFKEVMLSSDPLPSYITLSDDEFRKHARLIDFNYQKAARYTLLNPSRGYYIAAAKKDVRGYYYLTRNGIGESELADPDIVSESNFLLIKEALLKLCQNSSLSESSCIQKLESALIDKKLPEFYRSHFLAAKNTWENFFKISYYRSDVEWSENQMTVPFNTPSEERFLPYLRDNTQDEFRYGAWSLKLLFGNFDYGPRLVFKPGVVPHVNGLAGNQIVMDSNQPIEEYESKWTIRHEFGHVLGLPDCYHEFYDVKAQAFVSYQLDIKDLMCSRAGNMNERIYLELKRVYGHSGP